MSVFDPMFFYLLLFRWVRKTKAKRNISEGQIGAMTQWAKKKTKQLQILACAEAWGAPPAELISMYRRGLPLHGIALTWFSGLAECTFSGWRDAPEPSSPEELKAWAFEELKYQASSKGTLKIRRLIYRINKGLSWTQVRIPAYDESSLGDCKPFVGNWNQTDWIWFDVLYSYRPAGARSLCFRKAQFLRKPSLLWKAYYSTLGPAPRSSARARQLLRLYPNSGFLDIVSEALRSWNTLPEWVQKKLASRSPARIAEGVLAYQAYLKLVKNSDKGFWISEQGTFSAPGLYMEQIQDQEGLEEEGASMGHCVASYASRCASGQCSIWKALYNEEGQTWRTTVEIGSDGRVHQNRGHRNEWVPTPEAVVRFASELVLQPGRPSAEEINHWSSLNTPAFWAQVEERRLRQVVAVAAPRARKKERKSPTESNKARDYDWLLGLLEVHPSLPPQDTELESLVLRLLKAMDEGDSDGDLLRAPDTEYRSWMGDARRRQVRVQLRELGLLGPCDEEAFDPAPSRYEWHDEDEIPF